MSTASIDNIVKTYQDPVPYPIKTDGTADVNAGDQVYFDTSAKVVKSLGTSDDTNAANFAGIAMDGSFIQPYSAKQYDLGGQIPVLTRGIVRMKTTVGDTYQAGQPLYVGVDAQTVTNTVGGLTKKIGYVVMPPAQTSIAGGAGIFIQMEISTLFPVTSI